MVWYIHGYVQPLLQSVVERIQKETISLAITLPTLWHRSHPLQPKAIPDRLIAKSLDFPVLDFHTDEII